VESAADVDAAVWNSSRPVALLAQTTLAVDDFHAVERAVRERAHDVWTPQRADVCYATTNRQRALREVAGSCDAVVVLGSETSANTRALVDVARARCSTVLRVDDADELPPITMGRVGVTAGASAPEEAVRRVVEHLSTCAEVEHVSSRTEGEYFPLPAALRRTLQTALRAGSIPTPLRAAAADDRATSASELLDAVTDVVAHRHRVRVGVRSA
jgi:4-hydroxy-3-methylbut-2-enyl diphosphate reductase